MMAQAISEGRATAGIFITAGIFTALGFVIGYICRIISEAHR